MRSWGYKIILKYFAPISKNPIKYLSCAFALLGAFYTLVEIEQSIWSSEILLTFFRNNLAIIIFVIIFISIIIYREKLEFSAFLGTKDDKITLKMSDLFKLKDTAIVILTNTTFDTTMNGDFISEKSVQGQFQRKYYGVDFAELDKSLQYLLNCALMRVDLLYYHQVICTLTKKSTQQFLLSGRTWTICTTGLRYGF